MNAPRIFYTSDLHIGHRWVTGLRGFDTTEDHDAALFDMWSSTVTDKDTVYVLGDVALSGFPYALSLLSSLPGRKHLVAGNHDPVHPMQRSAASQFARWADVFASIQPFARRRLNGHEVLLSHFPYEAWGEGPGRDIPTRHVQYRLPDRGVPLMHGHTHGTEKAHGHELHVGLDAWGMQLVPQDTVIAWLDHLAAERALDEEAAA
jgi:calcineurin-like phosphoesterase family protein